MKRLVLFFFTTIAIIFNTIAQNRLPIIEIFTEGLAILDQPKIESRMEITWAGPEFDTDRLSSPNIYDGLAGIELRGSSSQSIFPKKGFGIETRDLNGENLNVSFLGFPAENDWVLHGPYSDKSLQRNTLAYHLASKMGRYAPRTIHCELYINDTYRGIYVLTEKIKRDKGRVNIAKLTPESTDITGGYIIKLDKFTGSPNEAPVFFSNFPPNNRAGEQTIPYQFQSPKAETITNRQFEYIKNYVNTFESVLAGPNAFDVDNGYQKYFDLNSLVDYFILNEVSKNVDGYRISTFFYKDVDSINTKMVIGPAWDYNLAFGNADYCEGGLTNGLAADFNQVCSSDGFLIPFWWDRLRTDQYFKRQLNCRYNELRSTILHEDYLNAYIDSTYQAMGKAVERNFERWPVLSTYVWPNNNVAGSYLGELNYMKGWLKDRLFWLDGWIQSNTYPCGSIINSVDGFEEMGIEVFPNPFANHFTIRNLKGEATVYQIIDLAGRVVQNGNLFLQNNEISFIGGRSFYMLQIKVKDQILSKKLISY